MIYLLLYFRTVLKYLVYTIRKQSRVINFLFKKDFIFGPILYALAVFSDDNVEGYLLQ